MNNEEKNLPETGEVNTKMSEEKTKKLSTGALIGIIAGAVAIVAIVVVLILTLGGGDKCDGHVDADDDYKCDKCGEDYDDGDEAVVPPATNTVDVTVTVSLDNGESLSGVKITLENNRNTYQLVSGADGSVKATVEPGNYAITYDHDTLPQYCSPETFSAIIGEEGASIALRIVNNTPDGSKEKPFYISENETEITLAPGQEIYFNYRGSSVKYATVENAAAVINYDGESYSAVDGKVTVLITPELGMITFFSVKNNSETEFTELLTLTAPLGSSENPIELTENSSSAVVSDEMVGYYSWKADEDGVLVLTSPTARNNISITKVMENDVLIISQTGGSAAAYLAVSAGDVVVIGVSALAPGEDDVDKSAEILVEFALQVYAGTESEPVPVLTDRVSISLLSGSKVAFVSEAWKTLSISDESPVWVYNGGELYTNDDGNEIGFELSSPIVFVENKSEHVNGIVISFE